MSDVSVIVPIYNAAQHIEKLIFQLKNQTFKKFEVILVDDGSTDDTFEKIRFQIRDDNRFKLFKQSNLGVSSARKLGVEKAKSEYIVFVDSDDIFSKNFLKKYYDRISVRKTDIEFFSINFENRDHDTKHFGFHEKDDKKIYSADELLIKLGSLELWGYPFMYISKKSLWKPYYFDSEYRVQEDNVALANLLIESTQIHAGTNSSKYYTYVYNDKSVMHTRNWNDYLEIHKVSDSISNKAKIFSKPIEVIKILNGLKLSSALNLVVYSLKVNNKNSLEKFRREFLEIYQETMVINRKTKIRRFFQWILIKYKCNNVLTLIYSRNEK